MNPHVAVFLICLFLYTCPPAGLAQAAGNNKDSQDLADARSLLTAGKLDEAIMRLKPLAQRQPPVRGAAHEIGTAYYQKNEFNEAIANLKQALAEDPHDDEAVQLLGLAYHFVGRPGEAIPLLERVQSWYPSANVDASYVLGMCYVQTKDFDHARKAFAIMYDVSVDSAAAYLFTARMLLRQELGAAAEDYAHKSITIDPKLPLAHFFLGEIYLAKSNIPDAIAEFRKELAVNPGHAASYYKLADADSRLLKFEDAQKLLEQSIWLDDTSSGPYILMGKVLLKKNELELAIRTLQHALAMDPNNYIAHHLLGEVYRAQGKSEDASRELKMSDQLQTTQTPRR